MHHLAIAIKAKIPTGIADLKEPVKKYRTNTINPQVAITTVNIFNIALTVFINSFISMDQGSYSQLYLASH